jgi:hypothetical protein
MRIAYFAHVNEGRASGVVAKITSQLEQWRHVGHTARLFLATKDTDLAWTDALGDVTVERYSGYPSRLVAMTRLVRSVRGFGPDVVYLRWDLFYPPMLALPSKRPLVAEINTDDLAEYALDRGIRARYNRLTRGLILGRADALVFVTSELSQRPAFRGASARRVVITNGIDLVDYPELPAPTDGPPRLVFVGGAIAPWHGVDRILELADRRPGWQFDIVGRDGPPQGGGNVHWHGTLERDALLAGPAPLRADRGQPAEGPRIPRGRAADDLRLHRCGRRPPRRLRPAHRELADERRR